MYLYLFVCHTFVILLSYFCHTFVILLSYFCHTFVILLFKYIILYIDIKYINYNVVYM